MRLHGLTGNIGSGKTTAGRLFAVAGVPVVDADQLARELVLPGSPALEEIALRFPGVVAGGILDRKALARRIFGDDAERAALERILHPRIAARAKEHADALAAQGFDLALYEAALLVESGMQKSLDGLIVVTAPLEVQIQRVLARDGGTEAEARARIAAQLPQERKVALADHILDNGGSIEELRAQVERLLPLLRAAPKRGSR